MPFPGRADLQVRVQARLVRLESPLADGRVPPAEAGSLAESSFGAALKRRSTRARQGYLISQTALTAVRSHHEHGDRLSRREPFPVGWYHNVAVAARGGHQITGALPAYHFDLGTLMRTAKPGGQEAR